jgi:hypothetical protein
MAQVYQRGTGAANDVFPMIYLFNPSLPLSGGNVTMRREVNLPKRDTLIKMKMIHQRLRRLNSFYLHNLRNY